MTTQFDSLLYSLLMFDWMACRPSLNSWKTMAFDVTSRNSVSVIPFVLFISFRSKHFKITCWQIFLLQNLHLGKHSLFTRIFNTFLNDSSCDFQLCVVLLLNVPRAISVVSPFDFSEPSPVLMWDHSPVHASCCCPQFVRCSSLCLQTILVPQCQCFPAAHDFQFDSYRC